MTRALKLDDFRGARVCASCARRCTCKLALDCFVLEGGELAVGDPVTLARGRACAEATAAGVFDD